MLFNLKLISLTVVSNDNDVYTVSFTCLEWHDCVNHLSFKISNFSLNLVRIRGLFKCSICHQNDTSCK